MPQPQTPAEAPELRYAVAPINDVAFRDASQTGDGSWLMEGYASVFEQETTLYDGRFMRLREVIDRGAFDNVLLRQPLVHLNHGHDMQSAIASTAVTGIGGLTLAAGDHGLHYTARVDRDDPDAQRLAVKMRRGVVNQASFAFTIKRVETTTTELEDGRVDELDRILEVGELYDVCVCAQGAYPQTVSNLRSYAAAILGRSDAVTALEGQPSRSPEGSTPVAPREGGPVVVRANVLAGMRARALAATFTHRSKT